MCFCRKKLFPRLAGRIRMTLAPYIYLKNPLQNIQECSTENIALEIFLKHMAESMLACIPSMTFPSPLIPKLLWGKYKAWGSRRRKETSRSWKSGIQSQRIPEAQGLFLYRQLQFGSSSNNISQNSESPKSANELMKGILWVCTHLRN